MSLGAVSQLLRWLEVLLLFLGDKTKSGVYNPSVTGDVYVYVAVQVDDKVVDKASAEFNVVDSLQI